MCVEENQEFSPWYGFLKIKNYLIFLLQVCFLLCLILTMCCFCLSVVHKVQPQMQGVQPEVVPVAPGSQSVPGAPPQVYFVRHVLMSLKSNFKPIEKPDLWLNIFKSFAHKNTPCSTIC